MSTPNPEPSPAPSDRSHPAPEHSPRPTAAPLSEHERELLRQAIIASPSYALVQDDDHFLARPELRAVRIMLEFEKPALALEAAGIQSTIVVFGGTRVIEPAAAERRLAEAQTGLQATPSDPDRARAVARAQRIVELAVYYDQAREFARLVSTSCQVDGQCDYVVVTGGGPGIMEAANRGAWEAGAKSIGFNITLPAEQAPNPFITPELCFQFRYFAMRKMHFLLRARALVVFPGGFGTLDELFDALTLRQTRRMQAIPIVMVGRAFWSQVLNFQTLADQGLIADADLELVQYAETPQEIWDLIRHFDDATPG